MELLSNVNQSQLISDDEYFKNIPVGYRFHPSDEELTEYLRKKVYNEPLPRNMIHQVNLYDFDPEVLAESYTPCGTNEWYFFTPRDKKYKNGHRPKRDAGDGFWKATGADKHVVRNGEKISSKKSLLYYKGRHPGGRKTCWMMHEYKLSNPPAPVRTSENSMRLDDWVLCRMVKKPFVVKKSETNGNADEQEAGPGNSRGKLETDNIVNEQAEEEIGQDTTLRIPMEASKELTMPCINQAQVPNIFTYNQPEYVNPSTALLNPDDLFYYSMGYQSFNSTPINQQAGISMPHMRWKLQHSLQGNSFAGYNYPYYIPPSPEISDLISTSQEPVSSVSGSDDSSHQFSASHEIPAPVSMIQGEYLSSQNPALIWRESAQYSCSNKIPGPISSQQDVDSSNPNPAQVDHEFPGPTFQGKTDGLLGQIQAPAPVSMIQGEYLSSQNPAQYSFSNKIPGPISRQQEVNSSNPNPAQVDHKFPGPTFQGQKEGLLGQIQAPAPVSMIQGGYPSSQNPEPIWRETARYSLSNKFPGLISRQQEVDSSNPNPNPNPAPVDHEFSGPTFQGQKEAPAAVPFPGSLEDDFPGIMGLGMNERWDLDLDLDFLSPTWGKLPMNGPNLTQSGNTYEDLSGADRTIKTWR